MDETRNTPNRGRKRVGKVTKRKSGEGGKLLQVSSHVAQARLMTAKGIILLVRFVLFFF